MDSSWVRKEIQIAQKAKLPVTLVIVRACLLPADLVGFPFIPANQGFNQERVRLEILDQLLDRKRDAAARLDAATREQLGREKACDDFMREYPAIVQKLDKVRDQPLRTIELEIARTSVPTPGTKIILQLDIDGWLFSRPLEFIVAPWQDREALPRRQKSRMWIYGGDSNKRPLVVCAMAWYDRFEVRAATKPPPIWHRALSPTLSNSMANRSLLPGPVRSCSASGASVATIALRQE